MGFAADLYRAQRAGDPDSVSSRVIAVDENQRIYRCVYRGSDALQIFKGCVGCPGNIKGYDCQGPEVLAKQRPKHICLVHAPELKAQASEEGYFVCSSCKYRTTFSLPLSPTWAVGITSAPRDESTLQKSVESLLQTGFYPTVFAEPDTDLNGIDVPVVQREELLGGWTNWLTTLTDLLKANADAILICQDDVIYAKGIREYINLNWPAGAEMVSLYCSSSYKGDSPFIKQMPARHGMYGALALAIARPTAERMAEGRMFQEYSKQKGVDGVIGRWARKQGIEIHICNPSLAQHIGDTSTIHPKARNLGRRRSTTFIGPRETAASASMEKVKRQSGCAAVKTMAALNWSPDWTVQVGIGRHHFEVDEIKSAHPNCEFHGFEPHPGTFENLTNYPGISANCAIGDRHQNAILYSKTGHVDGSSLFKHTNARYTEIPVVVYPLDYLLTDIPGDSNVLLWLDCEGSELNALKGGEKLTEKVDIINVEMTGKPGGEGWGTPSAVDDWLTKRGFVLLTEHTFREYAEQSDCIYIRDTSFPDRNKE